MGLLKKMSGSEEENRRMMDLVMDDDDLDDSSDDDSDLDGFSPDSKDHIKLTKLKWRCLKPLAPDGWVFWSENAVESQSPPPTTTHSSGGVPDSVSQTPKAHGKFTNSIICVIQNLMLEFYGNNHVLIQLWAPRWDGDRCVLTTANQPFGLSKNVNKLYDFRKECMNHKFYLDAESESADGVLVHVFRQKELAFTPDFRFYTNEEYPQRCNALYSVVQTSMAFPIIEPSTRSCVGVLEVTCSMRYLYSLTRTQRVIQKIKDVGLRSSDFADHDFPHVDFKTRNQVLQEISKGMKVVCDTHKLLLGQIWNACICCRDVELGGNCGKCNSVGCKGQQMNAYEWREGSYASTAYFRDFIDSCFDKKLRKGHGVGGRALLSHGPCFCKDVTRFRKIEYPLVHLARMFDLTSCFAICLRSTYTGNADYVMEFILPPNKNGGQGRRTLLYSILATMKQHFPSFKVASGKELGHELSIEVIEISKDRRPGDSFQISPITSSAPTIALRNVGDTVQLDSTNQQLTVESDAINNERNVVGPEQNNGHDVIYSENNDRNVAIDSTNEQLMVEADAINNEMNVAIDSTNQQLMVAVDAINNERNVAIDSTEQQLMVETDAMNTEMNVVGLEQNSGHNVIYSENNGFLRTLMEQETEIENQITRDVLENHFGMPLDDAAKKLKVNSRSTFKRICRKNGIKRWVGSKKKKGNGSLNKLNQVDESVQGGEGTACLTVAFSVEPNALAISAQPEQALEDMGIENERASHDLRNLCPTAAEASQQGLDVELHLAGLSMAPGLDPHAVISTRVLSLNTSTTLVSGNLSSGRIARLDEIQQSLEGIVIEDVVRSRDAESSRPSARDAFVVEEISESSSTNFPCPGTSTTPHVLEATQGVTRKATDGMYVIRFTVSSTSGIMELKNEVAERLQLQSDTSIMTCDVDAKELVLTTCDADLQVCLGILRSLRKHVIRLIVEPIAN